jgi:multiple sugar transport system substrate-binding protein
MRHPITRRNLLRTTGAAALAAAAPPFLITGVSAADLVQTPPTRNIRGTSLRILQWSHFVPSYDKWFDTTLLPTWGEANGVDASVDHVSAIDLPTTIASEITGTEVHDLIEYVAPLPQYQPSVLDLTDVVEETSRRHGDQLKLAKLNSYNPTANVSYGFCHGYAPDPGNYRKSLWEKAGATNGPSTWQELLDIGSQIKSEQGIQMGLGMSNEDDSNQAAQALLMSFGASVQDENERVAINSPETLAALEYMKKLFDGAMTDEVFGWNPASNNQLLIAGQASYILNSISAYRTAQQAQPDVANDVFFTPALKGPNGIALANGHAVFVYMIPKHAKNPDTAKEFLLYLVDNYDKCVQASELYNFPAWPAAGPSLTEGLKSDPFGSKPPTKLEVLADADTWTVNLGYPGPANAAIGEVFTNYILPQMFARAARGDQTPQESLAQAEKAITPIFDKWRKAGLIGGGQ